MKSQLFSSHFALPGARYIGARTRRALVASCIAVAPFGQSRPSLTGLSGSPSIWRSWVFPFTSFVYAISEQPTAQYGQREWTSFAPDIRRSSARFFAAATLKPRGFARGTSAIPALPAAPSFRNSRLVISVTGLLPFYSRIFAAASRAVDFSPDESVLRVSRQAPERGGSDAHAGNTEQR